MFRHFLVLASFSEIPSLSLSDTPRFPHAYHSFRERARRVKGSKRHTHTEHHHDGVSSDRVALAAVIFIRTSADVTPRLLNASQDFAMF